MFPFRAVEYDDFIDVVVPDWPFRSFFGCGAGEGCLRPQFIDFFFKVGYRLVLDFLAVR